MDGTMKAIEMTGQIDEHNQLKLDGELPASGPVRVKVIVLYPLQDDWDESEWLRAAAHNPAFESLKEAQEDIYSTADGKPFHDQT